MTKIVLMFQTLQEFIGVEEDRDVSTTHLNGAGKLLHTRSYIPLSDAVDWRKNGSVTSVKTQGRHCHSGYSFSAVSISVSVMLCYF